MGPKQIFSEFHETTGIGQDSGFKTKDSAEAVSAEQASSSRSPVGISLPLVIHGTYTADEQLATVLFFDFTFDSNVRFRDTLLKLTFSTPEIEDHPEVVCVAPDGNFFQKAPTVDSNPTQASASENPREEIATGAGNIAVVGQGWTPGIPEPAEAKSITLFGTPLKVKGTKNVARWTLNAGKGHRFPTHLPVAILLNHSGYSALRVIEAKIQFDTQLEVIHNGKNATRRFVSPNEGPGCTVINVLDYVTNELVTEELRTALVSLNDPEESKFQNNFNNLKVRYINLFYS